MLTDLELKDPSTARDEAREIFITLRTKEEQKIKRWHASLMKCSQEKVLDRIPFDYEDMSLKTLVPEWWADVPDEAVCKEQVAEANKKIVQINDIVREVYKDALTKLEEYNRLYGGG